MHLQYPNEFISYMCYFMRHWEGLQNGKYQAMLEHGVDLLQGEALAHHANGVHETRGALLRITAGGADEAT